MKIEPTINLYLEYCMSRQLRSRTIEAYEQTLRLFVNWLREAQAIEDVENVKDGKGIIAQKTDVCLVLYPQ